MAEQRLLNPPAPTDAQALDAAAPARNNLSVPQSMQRPARRSMPPSHLPRRDFLRQTAAATAAATLTACESPERLHTPKHPSARPKIDLTAIPSPILFQGDALTAFRDPTAVYHDGVFWLYYSYVLHEPDGKGYNYTAYSTSRDLVDWTAPRIFTPRDENLNFCAPGNVIRYNNEWILCLQSYPRPNFEKYGNDDCRIWIRRSTDLVNWSEPEMLKVRGPDVPVQRKNAKKRRLSQAPAKQPPLNQEQHQARSGLSPISSMGRIIDPYLIEDKDEPGKWWCFFDDNAANMSFSHDLETWTYFNRIPAGENVCILTEDRDDYLMFHSPKNGIGMKRSRDLKNWQDTGCLITLGQEDWPWAQGRITAGFVLDLRKDPAIGKYLMFFHGTGPADESVIFNTHACLAIAWSDDLVTWDWPGKHA